MPIGPFIHGSPTLTATPYPGMAPQGFFTSTNDLPPSQFYYPAQQAIMFPPFGMLPPMSSSLPIYAQNPAHSWQQPFIMPRGPLYGSDIVAQVPYPKVQKNTCSESQSPLLLEFHTNKTRNWELKVRLLHYTSLH